MHIWSIQFTSYQVGKLRQIVEDRLSTGFEKGKGSQDAIQRLCLSMHGEDEAKRSTDGFMPGLEKVSQMMVEKLDMKLEKVTDKLKKEIRYVEDEVTRSKEKTKNVGDLVMRNKRILEKLLEHSDRQPRENPKKTRKKQRARNSSSSSSSSEERGVNDRDKDHDIKDILVMAVKSVEKRVKELSASTKRSQQKVESDCQFVMGRVGEMTVTIQVVAENMDSVNDVAKRIEVLDSIQTEIRGLTEITKALSGSSLKMLELVRKIEKRGEGERSLPASDDKLRDWMEIILPKLDVICIRLLPGLENMEQQRYEKENLTLKELRGLVKWNTDSLSEKQTKLEGMLINIENTLCRIQDCHTKEESMLDVLLKNSMSDANALSSCNTSIQGMKVAVSSNGKEAIAAVQQVAASVKVVGESVRQVNQDVASLGSSLDEIGSQVRGLEREGGVCSEGLSKLQSSVEKMRSKLSGSGGVAVQTGRKEGGKHVVEKDELVVQIRESLNCGLAAVHKHDKKVGLALRTIVGLLKEAVANAKKNSMDVDNLIRRESSLVIEKIDKLNKTVSRIKYSLDDGSDGESEGRRKSKKRKSDATRSDPNPCATATVDLKPLEKLLGDMSSKLVRDLGGKKGEEIALAGKLQAMEDSIVSRLEEGLEQGGKFISETSSNIANVSNIVREITTQQDHLMGMSDTLARVPDFSSHAAALEESLCVNMQSSVREVINHAIEEFMTEMDVINVRLGFIKRYVKFGGKEVDDVNDAESGKASLDKVTELISGMAARLAEMQAAQEVGATGGEKETLGREGIRERLLTEIGKKADSESVQVTMSINPSI